jgi:hypothetical protein
MTTHFEHCEAEPLTVPTQDTGFFSGVRFIVEGGASVKVIVENCSLRLAENHFVL